MEKNNMELEEIRKQLIEQVNRLIQDEALRKSILKILGEAKQVQNGGLVVTSDNYELCVRYAYDDVRKAQEKGKYLFVIANKYKDVQHSTLKLDSIYRLKVNESGLNGTIKNFSVGFTIIHSTEDNVDWHITNKILGGHLWAHTKQLSNKEIIDVCCSEIGKSAAQLTKTDSKTK